MGEFLLVFGLVTYFFVGLAVGSKVYEIESLVGVREAKALGHGLVAGLFWPITVVWAFTV